MANVTIQSPEPPVELLPSHIAAVKNDIEKLSTLVQEKAPLVDPSTKETPLHAAAKTGSVEALKWLVKNKSVELDSKSATGYTPAHLAAVYGHLDSLKLLLTYDFSLGKKLAAMVEDGGLTVLSLATLQGDKQMVSWLLEKFPEIAHIANSNGDQVVHFAAAEGLLDILKMLVEKFGSEVVSRKDNRSTSAVFFAAQQGKVNVLDYLINELDQDPAAKDKDGLTTVHAATQNERASTVKWLINKLGPKYILEKTIDGATPLHMAAASGNTEILKFLLDNLEDKKNVNVTDNINATPAHDAAEYGKIKTMLLLLKNGADISITDTENKTPYQLALEQSHGDVADMLADFRDNGPTALQAYEKKRVRQTRDDKIKPRTSRQEAEELSNVIEQTTEALDTYKEKQLRRQESLNRMNEVGMDEEDDRNKKNPRGRPQNQGSPQKTSDDDDDIEHTLGPKGDLYAVPGKRGFGRSRVKGGRPRQNNDIDDFISETMSQREFGKANRGHHFRGGSYDEDPPNAAVNHDTASNYSRPSRVKRYQDSDSEISGLTGRSDYLYDGHSHGFYPPGYNPMYPPSLPPPRGKKGKRSAGSVTSKGSHQSGSQYRGPHPMGMSPAQFGYNQPMYFGYPQMYPGYAQPGGLIAIPQQQHQPAMQGFDPQGRPMFVPHPLQMQRFRQQQQQMQSRRKSLTDKKKLKKLSTESRPSPRKLHTDQEIGYGPGMDTTDSGNLLEPKYEDALHPPAPPISSTEGGRMEANKEVLKFDSNFLMAKPRESTEIRHHAGTALNPVKAKPKPYDGRYDEFIMTDSEEEYEVDEYHSVGFAAEVACILVIGCVAGLKGLSRMRRGKPALPISKPTEPVDKPALSTAWDVSYEGVEDTSKKKKGKKSRRNSISELDSSLVTDEMSPEAFAGHEEVGRTTWDKSKQKKPKKSLEEEKKRSANPEEPQSELLTVELQKQSYQSVSKALGEKLLYDTIGARHSSMLNIASSTTGSRMSLNASSADEGNDDDFGDAISILHGDPGPIRKKRSQPDPVSVDNEGDIENLLSENKEKHKKKKGKNKEKRDKERKPKRDKKSKKESREGSEEDAEVIENKEAMNDGISFDVSGEESGEAEIEGKQKREEMEEADKEIEKKREREKEEKELEKKEKELKEKEKREKKEQEKREKELREREKKEAAKEEREEREKGKKEREALEKEKKEVEKREKEQRDKEKKEIEALEKEKRDNEKKEKEVKERGRKEREKREKELKIKEKKENEAKEKKGKEEQREIERKEKEARVKERKEKEREEKEQKEREEREKREEEKVKRGKPTPSRAAPPPPGGVESADSSDEPNGNKKTGRLLSKSKDNGKKSQTPAQPPIDTSQAKPASKATPPSRVLERMKAAQPVKAPMEFPRPPAGAEFEYDSDEPREVENKVYMFDTESDESEIEEVPDVKLTRQRKAPAVQDPDKSITTDFNGFLESIPKPAPSSSGPRKNLTASEGVGIKTDETKMTHEVQAVGGSREGEGSADMLEGSSLHRHDDMQFSFGNDISAMADEMHNFYEAEDFTHTYEEGSTPSLDQESYSGIPGEDELMLVTMNDLERQLEAAAQTNQAYVSTQEQFGEGGKKGGTRSSDVRETSDSAAQFNQSANISEKGTQSSVVGRTKKKASHSIAVGGSVDTSEAGVQSSLQAFMHSIGTQENASYSESFEQNVLAMLQGMNDKMAHMKSNPTVTQNEIKLQELMQQQLIQSTIGMSLKDPEVMKNLLAMLKGQLKEDSNPASSRRRSSTAFDELQGKLLLAQEQQRLEAMKHFETQAEFQEYMRKQMEEQSRQQMMGIQTNFEMYSKKMQEQLAEQQKRWDDELKRRREEDSKSDKKRKRSRDKRIKKPRKPKVNRSSDSSQSDSDEGLMLQAPSHNKPKAVNFPAIKTMQATILTQNMLNDDDMKTESQVSIAKIKEKQEARGKLTRMNTTMKFDNASEAIRRYESIDKPYFNEKDEVTSENDPDDEEMIQVQAVRPVTLKRAEIKTQSGTGFTPARPEPPPPSEGKVGRIRRIESGSEADQPLTEGAGNELQQALNKRRRK